MDSKKLNNTQKDDLRDYNDYLLELFEKQRDPLDKTTT